MPSPFWFDDRVAQVVNDKSKVITVCITKHVNSTLVGKLGWTSLSTETNKNAQLVRLTYKDHAGNTHIEDFPVDDLATKRPKKGDRGLITCGEHAGRIVTIVGLLKKKTKFKVQASSSDGGTDVWVELATNVTEIADLA
jgi:hypothetical protein